MPMHLIREFKTTYSKQISLERYLILKVKEMEKENRLLRGKLVNADQEIQTIKASHSRRPPNPKAKTSI